MRCDGGAEQSPKAWAGRCPSGLSVQAQEFDGRGDIFHAQDGLPKGAGGRGEIHKLTAAACLYAGEAFNKAVTEACHIHGGSGYMQDTEINRLFRANKLLEIGAGTSEVRKIIIAEELLRA